jgi:hypothetical protein
MVAAGASLLLALAMWMLGRPIPVGFIYAVWVLGPPLVLAVLLGRSDSLVLCLQVSVLAGVVMVVLLHATLGDPEQFWAPFVRDLAQEMQRRGLPMDLEQEGLIETLARTLWGWVTVLTMLLALCALFLARWWQSPLRRRVPAAAAGRGARCRGRRVDCGIVPVGAAAGGRPGAALHGRADGRGPRGRAPLQGGGPAERGLAVGDLRPPGARGAGDGRRPGRLGIRGQLAAFARCGAARMI